MSFPISIFLRLRPVNRLQHFTLQCRMRSFGKKIAGRTREPSDETKEQVKVHCRCPSGNSTFRTPNSAFRTPHYTFRTPNSTFRIPHSALRIPHSTLRTPHSAFRTPHSALKKSRPEINRNGSFQCRMRNAECKMRRYLLFREAALYSACCGLNA